MGKIYVCQYRDIIQKVFLLWSLMSNYVNNHMILLMYFKICHLWWTMWTIRKVQVPQMSPNNHLPLPTIISPALCSHSLSLLDAGQLSHQICSKACENHPTISMLHSKYFLQQYKPSRDYPSKLSAADTHHVQQLIRSWKAGMQPKLPKCLWILSGHSFSFFILLLSYLIILFGYIRD